MQQTKMFWYSWTSWYWTCI